MNRSLPAGEADIARRDFLKACAALALTGPILSGCGPLVSRSRFTRILLADPSPSEYHPVLSALIQAVLPFEHPLFPRISHEKVLGRLEELFPLEEEERLKPLQRSLMILDDTTLFPHAFGPILSEERKILHAESGEAPETGALPESRASKEALDRRVTEALDQALEHDKSLHARFLKGSGARPTMVAMDPAARREYLWMWSQSAFMLKRQLYRTTKALIMITAYSTPELWHAIGYGGPLLGKT